MKTSIRLAFATLLLAAMALMPAFAQESSATLTVNGNVMTSSGGDFVPATSGQTVPYGTRVMVAEGSSASLTYPNGAVVNLTQPGVYTVSAAPVAAGVGVAAGTSAAAANAAMLGVAGVIVAAGAASSALDDDEDLLVPVSR